MTSSMTLACPFCRIALTPPQTVCPRDGHTGAPVEWIGVPPALGKRFRVLEPFAHGSTGSLYLADESETGRRGLLKVLSSVPKHREPERARLRRELGKQTSLGGGKLVVPWASGELDGITWLFRPWLDGISLRVRLRHVQSLPFDEALAITAQLAIALDELHRGGLLHRDLKPGHVFLQTNSQGAPKALLIDPGICGALIRPNNSTILGTPGYVAPEQLLGKLVSFRSDLYSLGCVMYEMVAGRPPFSGDTEQAILTAQLTEDPPLSPVGLPDGVASLLRSLISREPQERPFSAQKLRRILEPYAPDGTPMTRPPTTTFGTMPDSESPAAQPSPAPSLPPAPPAEALRAAGAPSDAPKVSKSDAPRGPKTSKVPPAPAEALRASKPAPARPPARPTTRGLAPPPPPRASAEETQQIDLEALEEVEQEAKSADATQELSPAHFIDVQVHAEPAAPAAAKPERDDLTVPVRLDQILAISPAKLRASAPPVPHEPAPAPASAEPARPPEPANAKPAEPLAPEQTMFVEDEHETVVFPDRGGAHGLPAPSSSLFGALPAVENADGFSGAQADDQGDDDAEKTTVAHRQHAAYASDAPGLAHLRADDDDPTTALPAPSGLAPQTIDDNNEEAELASRSLQDTLRPYGLSGSRRNVTLGLAAAAVLGLGVVAVKALVGGGEEKLAAREVAPPPPSAPAVSASPIAEPTVEPSPSVTALAAAPKHEADEATVNAAPAPAEPSAAPGAATPSVEGPHGATLTPIPAVEALPATKENEAKVADVVATKSAEARSEPSREDSRRQKREEKARAEAERQAKAAAERAAKTAAAQSKQAKKASAGNDRTAKWNEAVEEARAHYAAKRYKQAAQAYERASQFDPTSDRTFSGLGTARFKAGDYKGAAAAYQRAVQLAPSNSVYHTSLARTYQQMGDVGKAKAAYKRAISLDPNNEGAKKSLKQLGG